MSPFDERRAGARRQELPHGYTERDMKRLALGDQASQLERLRPKQTERRTTWSIAGHRDGFVYIADPLVVESAALDRDAIMDMIDARVMIRDSDVIEPAGTRRDDSVIGLRVGYKSPVNNNGLRSRMAEALANARKYDQTVVAGEVVRQPEPLVEPASVRPSLGEFPGLVAAETAEHEPRALRDRLESDQPSPRWTAPDRQPAQAELDRLEGLVGDAPRNLGPIGARVESRSVDSNDTAAFLHREPLPAPQRQRFEGGSTSELLDPGAPLPSGENVPYKAERWTADDAQPAPTAPSVRAPRSAYGREDFPRGGSIWDEKQPSVDHDATTDITRRRSGTVAGGYDFGYVSSPEDDGKTLSEMPTADRPMDSLGDPQARSVDSDAPTVLHTVRPGERSIRIGDKGVDGNAPTRLLPVRPQGGGRFQELPRDEQPVPPPPQIPPVPKGSPKRPAKQKARGPRPKWATRLRKLFLND